MHILLFSNDILTIRSKLFVIHRDLVWDNMRTLDEIRGRGEEKKKNKKHKMKEKSGDKPL